MFKGDLVQFAPADLLLFLCHMGKEGVLTVRRDGEVLSLGFQRNLLVEAHGEAADRLILAELERAGVGADILERLRRGRKETGLPLPRILEEVPSLPAPAVAAALQTGLQETVLRLLLLDRGEFQFNEIAVDLIPHLPPGDGQALVMDLTRQVDEYRELLRGLAPLERRPVATACAVPVTAGDGAAGAAPPGGEGEPTAAPTGDAALSPVEQYVLDLADSAATAADLLETAALPRLVAARAIRALVDRGRLELVAARAADPASAAKPTETTAFSPYRQALRRLLQAGDQQRRIRELLSFAQTHCKVTVLMAVHGGRLRRATVYYRDPGGRLTARDHRDPGIDLAGDQVFQRVLAHGVPFLGEVFPSPVLDAIEAEAPAADCAVLPLGAIGGHDLLLYAATASHSPAVGPLACLELLSWQLRTPSDETRAAGPSRAAAAVDQRQAAPAAAAAGQGLDAMVAKIKDLPPMPQVIARILDLLSNPDCKLAELTAALSQDPALVARLIKVSNSSLYGGGQSCGSLNQAIVRLGTRTTRSVVVAASTRSLFPADGSRVGLAGRTLWRHAVETGLAARRVAEFMRWTDPDEAFAGGVLHDLGKLIILLNLPDEACEIQRRRQAGEDEAGALERRVLGFDHTEVGERLLQGWSMPPGLVACARWHHQPEAAGQHQDLVRLVGCGDLLSHCLGDGAGGVYDPESPAGRRLAAVTEAMGLDESSRTDLLGLLALDLEQGDLLD
jgi:HD-like signal output (HDOD) protein